MTQYLLLFIMCKHLVFCILINNVSVPTVLKYFPYFILCFTFKAFCQTPSNPNGKSTNQCFNLFCVEKIDSLGFKGTSGDLLVQPPLKAKSP